MDKDGIEIIRKHLGKGGFFELTNEDGTVDKFYMPPVPADMAGELWYVYSKFSGKPEDFMKLVDRDIFNILTDLITKTLKESEDFKGMEDNEIQRFAVANMIPIVTKFFEINDMGAGKMTTDREAIKRARTLRELREKKYGNTGATEGEVPQKTE